MLQNDEIGQTNKLNNQNWNQDLEQQRHSSI